MCPAQIHIFNGTAVAVVILDFRNDGLLCFLLGVLRAGVVEFASQGRV